MNTILSLQWIGHYFYVIPVVEALEMLEYSKFELAETKTWQCPSAKFRLINYS